MGRNRFVTPEVVRLPLSDGDWIDVKKHLTAGEQRAVATGFIGKFLPDGSRVPNLDTLGMHGVLAYLVEWSFRDAKDKPVPVTLNALKNLHGEDYAEIDAAIDAHITAMDAEVAEAKKARGETAA